MKLENRKSVYDDLNKYDHVAQEDDFIEVTEWTNGEGWDINIYNNNKDNHIQLSYGELDAINYLVKTLEVEK